MLKEEDVVNYDFVEVVDGYEDSLSQMKAYEKKYNLLSIDFFNTYKIEHSYERISCSEAKSWAFEIECFLLCDGKLEKEEIFNDMDLSNIEFTIEEKNSEKNYKRTPKLPSYSFFNKVYKEFV